MKNLLALILIILCISPAAFADDDHDGHRHGPRVVNCGGDALTDALSRTNPGDTLVISGVCTENIVVSSTTGQFDGVTLDGQGTGSIVGPDVTLNTLELDGVRGFTVQNLTISGGRDGVSINGGTLVGLDGLIVQGVGRHGIHYQRMSSGFVVNSTIQNNPGNGIISNENSYVRIGFTNGVGASEGDVGPNLIQGNGGFGIRVQRQSSVRAYNNTISSNVGDGVHIESMSYAEVASSVLDSNGKSAVFVSENSVLHLGNATGTKNEDVPNTTNTPNGTFGLTAQWGAYVQGRLGTLRGLTDGASFTHGAQNNLTP